jgi:hypothetical protein
MKFLVWFIFINIFISNAIGYFNKDDKICYDPRTEYIFEESIEIAPANLYNDYWMYRAIDFLLKS